MMHKRNKPYSYQWTNAYVSNGIWQGIETIWELNQIRLVLQGNDIFQPSVNPYLLREGKK